MHPTMGLRRALSVLVLCCALDTCGAFGPDWLDGCPNGDGDGGSSGRRDGSSSSTVGSAITITDLLFSSLNMSYPGLARVAAAHSAGNLTGACNEVGLRVIYNVNVRVPRDVYLRRQCSVATPHLSIRPHFYAGEIKPPILLATG